MARLPVRQDSCPIFKEHPNRYGARRQNAGDSQIIRPTWVIVQVNATHREAPFR